MTSKNRILLDFNAQQNNKIKHLSIHPRKDYIGILTVTNNFSLWNYKQKILLKSFSCNSLDDNPNTNNPNNTNTNTNNTNNPQNNLKQLQIKETLFYDRYSLPTTAIGTNVTLNNNNNTASGLSKSNLSNSNYNHNVQDHPITLTNQSSSLANMKNNIIFVTSQRIFLYDYVSDVIKSINQKQLQQKNIRKVAIYSQNKICIVLNDGSFKVLDIQKLYSKQQEPQATIKTFKGYHTKPISWIFAYSQNVNQMPRVITVSGSDGLMACWNVDSMLQNSLSTGGFHKKSQKQQQNTIAPCFKFIMNKGNKNDSNNGQQIISLQYDPSSYHLVTLTQSFLTIWSTMTGMQLKRIKNTLKLKQIIFFNHFSFASGSFIGHCYGSILYIVRYSNQKQINSFEIQDQINLKQFVQEADLQILNIKNIPEYPANLFIITSTDLLIMEIDKFYRTSFGIHPSFVTKLTTFNSRNFIKKGEGQFKKPIVRKQIQSMQFPQDILYNTFYLSYENNWIYFHLIQLQYKNMIHESHKYKLQKINSIVNSNNSVFSLPQSNLYRTQVKVSYDGKQISLFNKNLSYYQIYSLKIEKQKENNLIGDDQNQTQNYSSSIIDFYHSLDNTQSGICRNIVWHQYKSQYAAICPFDKNGKLVEYQIKEQKTQKKPIFSNNSNSKKSNNQNQLKTTGQIFTWHICIFENKKQRYEMIFKSPSPVKTKLFSLFSLGQQYAYSTIGNQQKTSSSFCEEYLQFISSSTMKNTCVSYNQFNPVSPQKVLISYCQTYHIYCYQGYFIIYKVQQNGSLSYYKTIQQTILQGLFWQKFFFFVTKNGIYFLQLLNERYLTVCIQIADSCGNYSRFNISQIDKFFMDDPSQLNTIQNQLPQQENILNNPKQIIFQDIQCQTQNHLLPQGQIQIVSIVNMHLLIVNQIGRQYFLNLKYFPYIQFCLQISSGYLQRAGYIYRKSSYQMRELMKDTLTSYGLILSSILY